MHSATILTPHPAELYQQFFGPAIFEPCARLLVPRAAPRPGERALDLACGTGIVTRRLAAAVGPGGSVVGVDLRPGMLAVARALPVPDGAATIDWRQGDAIALDLPDATFDVALCQHGLQFFSDRLAALRGVRGTLTDGGRLALAVWQSLDRHPLFVAMMEAEARHLGPLGISTADAAAPFSLGSAAELDELLAAAGFRGMEITAATVACDFPAAGFVQRCELAYTAVMPHLAEDRGAFGALVAAVETECAALIDRHRDGDRLRFPMHANLAVARK